MVEIENPIFNYLLQCGHMCFLSFIRDISLHKGKQKNKDH